MHFNASVEPIPHYLEETIRVAYPKKDYKRIKGTLDLVASRLKKMWPNRADAIQKILYPSGSNGNGGLKANILMDRFGLLRDLREFTTQLQERLLDEGATDADDPPFAHLLNIGDTDGVLLPFRFNTPLQLDLPDRPHPYPVGSVVALRDELALLNQHLKVEQTFKLSQLPPYIEASQQQIDQFEQACDVDPSFWIKFPFTVLRTLNDVAFDSKLPVIFHYF